MRWIVCDVITPVTITDRLGNKQETGEYEVFKTTRARYSPLFSLGADIENRDVTKREITLTLPLSLQSLPEKFYLRTTDGVIYDVTEKKHWEGRWTICRGVVFGGS